MLRGVFTIISYFCLAGGFVAAVIDGTRSLGMGGMAFTTAGDVLQPRFPNLPLLLFKAHPMLWDPIGVQVMRLPLCLFLGTLGLLLLMIIGRKPEKRGFASTI